MKLTRTKGIRTAAPYQWQRPSVQHYCTFLIIHGLFLHNFRASVILSLFGRHRVTRRGDITLTNTSMKCKIRGCKKNSIYKETVNPYCHMHKARIMRNGYSETKKERGEHACEKIPHEVDSFILRKALHMTDLEISLELAKMGHSGITRYNVGYRRRKLGRRKYSRGEIKKHRAWIRTQALEKYGSSCELCTYDQIVDTHHIHARKDGGLHTVENLMVICPNCHGLITRRKIEIPSRTDIPEARKMIIGIIKSFYSIF